MHLSKEHHCLNARRINNSHFLKESHSSPLLMKYLLKFYQTKEPCLLTLFKRNQPNTSAVVPPEAKSNDCLLILTKINKDHQILTLAARKSLHTLSGELPAGVLPKGTAINSFRDLCVLKFGPNRDPIFHGMGTLNAQKGTQNYT